MRWLPLPSVGMAHLDLMVTLLAGMVRVALVASCVLSVPPPLATYWMKLQSPLVSWLNVRLTTSSQAA